MSGFTTELQPAPCIHVYMHIHTRKKINAEACTLVGFFFQLVKPAPKCVYWEPNLLVLPLVNVLITETEEDQIA